MRKNKMRREKTPLTDGKEIILGLDSETQHQILQISIKKGKRIQAFAELNQAEANWLSDRLQSIKEEMAP